MILVDTSIWIDHFRNGNNELKNLLYENKVLTHPFVIGELACGSIKNRSEIFSLLNELPSCTIANSIEVLSLIKTKKLYGKGIGFIDAHLLASALISKVDFLTKEKNLHGVYVSLTK